MKLYCITWKDERWSADKQVLKDINDLINKYGDNGEGYGP